MLAIGFSGSAIAVLASGCGSTAAKITKAQAIAYAHAVNLDAADVPEGSESIPGIDAVHVSPQERQLLSCAGAVSVNQRVATFASPVFRIGNEFERDPLSLESIVTVYPSVALAARNLSALASTRAHACFARVDRRLFGSLVRLPTRVIRGVKVTYKAGPTTITSIKAPAGSGLGDFTGFRAQATVTATRPAHTEPNLAIKGATLHFPVEHETFPIFREDFVFRVGAAVVELHGNRSNEEVPSTITRRLLYTLHSRAKAHAL